MPTHKLLKPVKVSSLFRNAVIELVILRAPTVRDFIGLEFSGIKAQESMVELIRRCSNLSKEQVLDLEVPDFAALSEELNKLMSGRG
jgi:hypothetical protein